MPTPLPPRLQQSHDETKVLLIEFAVGGYVIANETLSQYDEFVYAMWVKAYDGYTRVASYYGVRPLNSNLQLEYSTRSQRAARYLQHIAELERDHTHHDTRRD